MLIFSNGALAKEALIASSFVENECYSLSPTSSVQTPERIETMIKEWNIIFIMCLVYEMCLFDDKKQRFKETTLSTEMIKTRIEKEMQEYEVNKDIFDSLHEIVEIFIDRKKIICIRYRFNGSDLLFRFTNEKKEEYVTNSLIYETGAIKEGFRLQFIEEKSTDYKPEILEKSTISTTSKRKNTKIQVFLKLANIKKISLLQYVTESLPLARLVTYITDDSLQVRKMARKTLLKLDESTLVSAAIDALSSDNKIIREEALEILKESINPQTVEQLFPTLRNGTAIVCQAVFTILESKTLTLEREQYVDAYVNGLINCDQSIQEKSFEQLKQLKDSTVIKQLLNFLGHNEMDVRTAARKALDILRVTKEDLITGNIDALGSKSWEIKKEAVEVLGDLGDRRAVEPLIQVIPQTSFIGKVYSELRLAIIDALVKLNDSHALEKLLVLITDSHDLVRSETRKALEKVDLPMEAIIDANIVALQSEVLEIRVEARCALEAFESVYTVKKIVPLLTSQKKYVKENAALLLSQFSGETLIGLNNKLVDFAIEHKRIPLYSLPPSVETFLTFLEQNDCTDIVLKGRTVLELFFGIKPSLFEISVKIPFTEKGRELIEAKNKKALIRVHDLICKKVDEFAQKRSSCLGEIEKDDVQMAEANNTSKVFGDIKIEEVSTIDFIVDSKTGKIIVSEPKPSFLHIALDSKGNLYGNMQVLEELKKGIEQIIDAIKNSDIQSDDLFAEEILLMQSDKIDWEYQKDFIEQLPEEVRIEIEKMGTFLQNRIIPEHKNLHYSRALQTAV
ncbi:HEAT repeat domain-containing protein [Chlamydiota bacterium]